MAPEIDLDISALLPHAIESGETVEVEYEAEIDPETGETAVKKCRVSTLPRKEADEMPPLPWKRPRSSGEEDHKVLIDIASKHGYNIACALRGPDLQVGSGVSQPIVNALKNTFATRIRHLAGTGCMIGVGFRTFRIRDKEAEALLELVRPGAATPFAVSHYLRHCRAAAWALGDKDLAELAGWLAQAADGWTPPPNRSTTIKLAGGDLGPYDHEEVQEKAPLLDTGTHVRITAGPFAGWQGTVNGTGDGKRLVLLPLTGPSAEERVAKEVWFKVEDLEEVRH